MIVTGCRKLRSRPSLDHYDNRAAKAGGLHQPDQVTPDFKASLALEKEYPPTRVADKALLVALGVNGEVPLAQAMANAGLARTEGLGKPQRKFSETFRAVDLLEQTYFPANDNYAVSAKAA